MNKILGIVIRLTLGFFICACGTVMSLKSNLGLSPWNVFHQGIANVMNITIGQASIIVGLVIVIITSLLGIKIGLGTLANMIIIGCFIDLIIYMDIIPTYNNLLFKILMMIGSLFAIAIGSFIYIGCEMGCGPRDGLMLAIVNHTNKPIGLIRFCIELGALAIGWILGGQVGIGTVITVFGIGYCVQLVYKILNFDVNSLKHKNIKQGFIFINECIHIEA